jgi:hypothetical protein
VIRIGVDVTGLAEVQQALTEFSKRRLDAALATALTRTAVRARDDVRQSMLQVFDRPTQWTLNGVWVQTATGTQALAGEGVMPTGRMLGPDMPITRNVRRGYLEAMVYLKDDASNNGTPAAKYLLPQIEGGQRAEKGIERNLRAASHLPAGWFVVPGAGARLDQHGNISRGQIIQILSQLRITMLSGYTRNMSLGTARARQAQRRAGGRFFVIQPGTARIAPGVYQREFIGNNITPVLIFVRRATYRRRLDFYGVVERTARRHLADEVRVAVAASWERLQATRAGRGGGVA